MSFNEINYELLIQRDPKTIEQLVRTYTSHLYKAGLGMGLTAEESDDITQAVWLTFFDIVPEFKRQSTVRTFLFGILYNKISEYRRKNKKTEPSDQIDQIVDSYFEKNGEWVMAKAPISPEQFLISTQVMELLQKCLDLLPIHQKMAFIMKEIEEAITDEICAALEITATHLGVVLFRARNQLRICIESKSR